MADDKPKTKKQPYRDTFGQSLTQQDVTRATNLIVQTKKPTTMLLTRYLKFGVSKAKRILKVLEDAKVIVKDKRTGDYTVILRGDSAVNAALRQLKKGRGSK